MYSWLIPRCFVILVAVVKGIFLVIFSRSYCGRRETVELCSLNASPANFLSLISSDLFESLFFSKLTLFPHCCRKKHAPFNFCDRQWSQLKGLTHWGAVENVSSSPYYRKGVPLTLTSGFSSASESCLPSALHTTTCDGRKDSLKF